MKAVKRPDLLEQLDSNFKKLSKLKSVSIPVTGWLRLIRLSLNMSLKQFGQRLGITPQSARDIEEREKSGSISLKSLKDAADALDMDLFYILLPKQQTLKNTIEKRVNQFAEKIVLDSYESTLFKDQKEFRSGLKILIKEKAEEIKKNPPRSLWD